MTPLEKVFYDTLRRLEWKGPDETCPACGASISTVVAPHFDPRSHAGDCYLAAALHAATLAKKTDSEPRQPVTKTLVGPPGATVKVDPFRERQHDLNADASFANSIANKTYVDRIRPVAREQDPHDPLRDVVSEPFAVAKPPAPAREPEDPYHAMLLSTVDALRALLVFEKPADPSIAFARNYMRPRAMAEALVTLLEGGRRR